MSEAKPDSFLKIEPKALKICVRKQKIIPINRREKDVSIPWNNIRSAQFWEKKKAITLELINPHGGDTKLSWRDKDLSYIDRNKLDGDVVLHDDYKLNSAKLYDKVNKHVEDQQGPQKTECHKTRIKPEVLLAGLAFLAISIIVTQSPEPTDEVVLGFFISLAMGIFGVIMFIRQCFSKREIELNELCLEIIRNVPTYDVQHNDLDMASIPWSNLEGVFAIEKPGAKGLGLRLRNFQDENTLLDETLAKETKKNYENYRCDLFIPLTDRDVLYRTLQHIGNYIDLDQEEEKQEEKQEPSARATTT